MGIKYTNNAEATLGANLTAIATTLTLDTNEGDYFPVVVAASGDHFYCTIVDQAGQMEIIKVTEHQTGTDIFQTIERAADAVQLEAVPTAYAFVIGDKVQARIVAKQLEDIHTLDDNAPIILGAGPDGRLVSDGTSLYFLNGAGTENIIKMTQAGSVHLYNNNIAMFSTTAAGATLFGVLTCDGLTMGDNEDITFGAGPDAKISSNGTALVIENGAGDETMAVLTQNAGVALYFNDNIALDTTIEGINVRDTTGANAVLNLTNNNGTAYAILQTTSAVTNDLWISTVFASGDIYLSTQTSSVGLKINDGGSADLYYDGTAVVKTKTGGLQLYVSGTNYADIQQSVTGKTYVWNQKISGHVLLTGTDSGDVDSTMLDADPDAGVKLYFDGVEKFDVLTDGIAVVGALDLTEITTPTPVANHGKIYTKSDNKVYFQDGAGVEHEIAFA